MATQLTSTPSQITSSPRIAAKRPPKVDTQNIPEGPDLRVPPSEDTFVSSPTTESLPPVPPNTPVKATSPKAKVQFGSRNSTTDGTQKGRGMLGGITGAATSVARAGAQGLAYLIGSNFLTVPTALILGLTGVGILPALGVLFLGPLAAGAYGAIRGYQGSFV